MLSFFKRLFSQQDDSRQSHNPILDTLGAQSAEQVRDHVFGPTLKERESGDSALQVGVAYDEATGKQIGLERDIEDSIEYTVRTVVQHVKKLPDGVASLKRGDFLEVGPGQDLGVVFGFLGLGSPAAQVVDKYFCSWNEQFHPRFYRELTQKFLEVFGSGFDQTVIDETLASRQHRTQRVNIVEHALEEVDLIADRSIFLSYSNAVLEHLYDHRKAIEQLGRITMDGGYGFHQVDHRDHRDFDKPLEYLTVPLDMLVAEREGGLQEFVAYHGSVPRSCEYISWFEHSGFLTQFAPNIFASDSYIEDVFPRLLPQYRAMGREEIRMVSGQYCLEKLKAC